MCEYDYNDNLIGNRRNKNKCSFIRACPPPPSSLCYPSAAFGQPLWQLDPYSKLLTENHRGIRQTPFCRRTAELLVRHTFYATAYAEAVHKVAAHGAFAFDLGSAMGGAARGRAT